MRLPGILHNNRTDEILFLRGATPSRIAQ